MKKRWIGRSIKALAALAVLVVLLPILLLLPSGGNWAFHKAGEYLRQRAGIELRADRVRLNPFTGSIRMENLSLRAAHAPGLPPLLRADLVDADLGLIAAFRRVWTAEALKIHRPRIHYFVGRDGETNLPEMKTSEGEAPDLRILSAGITDGALQWEDLRGGFRVDIPSWDLAVEGTRGSRAHRVTFAGRQESTVTLGDLSIPIDALMIAGVLDGAGLRIDSARISAAHSTLDLQGTVRDLKNLDLELAPRLDVGAIAAAAGYGGRAAGSISGAVGIEGPLDDPRIALRLAGMGVRVETLPPLDLSLSAEMQWNRAETRLELRSLDLASPEGSLAVEGTLFAAGADQTSSLHARLRNIHLLPFARTIGLPFRLASQAGGTVSASWRGKPSLRNLRAGATLELRATRPAPEADLLPVTATLATEFAADRLRARIGTVSLLGAQAAGEFSLHSFRTFEGSLRGEAADIDDSLRQLGRFLGRPGPPAGVDLAGHLNIDVRGTGRLDDPEFEVRLDAPSLAVAGMKGMRTEAHAVYRDRTLSFQNNLLLPADGRLEARGDLALGDGEPRLRLAAGSAAPIRVEALNTLLGRSMPMSGTLETSLHLGGPVDHLTGNLAITGEGLSLYHFPLGHLDAFLDLADREVRSSRLRLYRNPGNPSADLLTARVYYALDTGRYDFQAEGAGIEIDAGRLPGGARVSGTLALSASGSGTIEDPSLDLQLGSNDLCAWGQPLGLVSITARVRGEGATIRALAPDLDVSSNAALTLRDPFPFRFTLQARDSDLAAAGIQWRGRTVTGSLRAEVEGFGDLGDLEGSRFEALIEDFQARAGDLEVRTEAPARLRYREHSLELSPPLTLAGGASALELGGRLPVRESAPEGNLRLKGQLDLADTGKIIPPPGGFGFHGVLGVDVVLSGAYGDYDITGEFALDDGSLTIPKAAAPVTGVAIRGKIGDGALVLERAAGNWGGGSLSFSGILPLGLLPESLPLKFARRTGPAEFALEVNRLAPEATGFLPRGVSGLVSLRGRGQAERFDLRALDADIRFGDLAFEIDNIDFSQADPVQVEIRRGIASIARFALAGPETRIEASGTAGVYPQGPLDLSVSGFLDSGLLGALSGVVKTAGKVRIDARVTGALDAPVLSGRAEMDNGKVALHSPRMAADDVKVRLDLTSDALLVREFTGVLNGGAVSIEGSVGYRSGIYNGIDLKARLEDVFLNFPEGLKSSSSGNLTMKSEEDAIIIGGDMRVMESSYRESIEVGGQLVNYLKSQQVVTLVEDPHPFLDRIRFDIAVRTATPLLVQNNIARVEASTTNLRLVGSYADPSVVGRVTLGEGGEIVLNQQTYYINQGVVTLVNQSRIEPEFNIQAQTKIDLYEITLQLTGNPDRMSTLLSSDPPLSERDILSLLLTGKTVSETQGREMQMARTQALSLIAGQAGEGVTNEARKALHLSTFRIDPGLIASESNPGARLTIGEDVTRDLSLVYSMNLVNGGDQIWAAQYDIGRRLTTQATKQQDNSYRFEFRHDLRFGGTTAHRQPRQRTTRFEIGSVHFSGEEGRSDKDLIDRFRNRPGDRYDFQKVQQGLDRLHAFYFDQNLLEADIRLQRETRDRTVDLKVTIDPGPVVEFDYGAFPLGKSVRERVARAWADGVFEAERMDEATMVIRRSLTESGYLEAEVSAEMGGEDGRRRVRFDINPGPRHTKVPLAFPGAEGIRPGALRALVAAADLERELYVDPGKVADFLTRYYRNRGYLHAEVDPPEFRPDAGETVIAVSEGPLFVIGELEFSGNTVFDYDELWMVIPTSSGSVYNPESLRESIREMENLYHGQGYNDVSITFRVLQDTPNTRADVNFQITERRQSVIRDIVIEGNRGTGLDFVTRQFDFQVGDPLDYEKINETRRRLYSTGVYTTVDFQMEEFAADGQPAPGRKDVRVRLRLRETQPYRLQYGLFYDTERGVGGLVEAQHLNLLGRATNLGLRLRYDSDLKEGRLYYHQPFVTRLHLKMDASAFWQQETRTFFSAKRIGFSLMQERELPREFRFDYGYRYDHVRWNGLPPDPILFQASDPVARLTGTLTRDTRDSVLDATRGEFHAHTLEFGPRWLGSEVGFARYSGQYFRYVPLDKYLGKPIVNRKGEPLPTNFVYAAALRLGLTSPFGKQSLIAPERFFSGGGTTMRGFGQDLLGPLEEQPDGSLRPSGGEAMFLFNNELRFPIVGILQGVAFLDIGNVYRKLADFDFSMRKTAGAGLRLKIKSIPLRFDYGFKLDRKTGESGGEFFFSIGQAF
jgi:outer membrane protein assembly complex protein YaeT